MASANVLELTVANWEQEVAKSDKPVIVDFWAPWCGPCRAIAPIIDKIATQFAGKVKVGKLNIDDHGELATQYDVSGIPTLLFFKGGKQVEKIVGLGGSQPEVEIAKILNRLVSA
jgi:thioredoxin 1